MGAGTRRIQAWTGRKAKENQLRLTSDAEKISQLLSVDLTEIPLAVGLLSRHVKDLKKQLSAGKKSAGQEKDSAKLKSASNPALTYFEIRDVMRQAARGLNIPVLEVAERVNAMLAEVKTLEEQLEKLGVAGQVDADDLISSAQQVGDIRVIAKELPGANRGLMVQLIDQVRKKASPVAILFATSPGEGEVLLSAGLSRDLVDRGINAGKWIAAVASVVDGKGGGKPDLAQAGGKNPEKISAALVAAVEFMKSKQST